MALKIERQVLSHNKTVASLCQLLNFRESHSGIPASTRRSRVSCSLQRQMSSLRRGHVPSGTQKLRPDGFRLDEKTLSLTTRVLLIQKTLLNYFRRRLFTSFGLNASTLSPSIASLR